VSGEGAGGGGERRRRVGVGGRSTNWCGGQQPFVLVWARARADTLRLCLSIQFTLGAPLART
jgi:hypothetical protein